MSGSNRFRDPLKLALRGSKGSLREEVGPDENGMMLATMRCVQAKMLFVRRPPTALAAL
jgi:hypothetical protein